MRTSILIALFALAAPLLTPQTAPPGGLQTVTVIVRGTVQRWNSTEPIAEAQVTLTGSASQPAAATRGGVVAAPPQRIARSAVTDNGGRFSFSVTLNKDSSPGSYQLQVQAEGYRPLNASPENAFTIDSSDRLIEIGLTLVALGTVSGVVRDPDGQPLSGIQVSAMTLNYDEGRPVLGAAKSVQTDDRGQYRLFGLVPGDYLIRADTRPLAAAQPVARAGWARTYFPGVADVAGAIPIVIGEGSDLPGRDFTIQSNATYRISGKVTIQIPNPRKLRSGEPDLSVSSFYLVPRGVGLDDDYLPSWPNTATEAGRQAGQFEIRGVHPGLYDLYPVVQGDPNSADNSSEVTGGSRQNFYTSLTRIDVVDRDVEGISPIVGRGVDVSIRFVGNAPPPPVQGGPSTIAASANYPPGIRNVRLIPKESTPSFLRASIAALPGSFQSTGFYVYPNIAEGKYALDISTAPELYVADIRQGGASIIDSGVTITTGPPEQIEVILGSGSGTIKGTVQDKNREPAPNSTVVLVPQPPHRQTLSWYRTARTSATGTFTMSGIAPGSYKLFSWEGFSPSALSGEYFNAEFIGRYETQGRLINVSAIPSANVALDLIAFDYDSLLRGIPLISGRPPAPGAPSQMASLTTASETVSIKLIPRGAIGGRVLSPTGRPISGLTITALTAHYSDGRRTLSPATISPPRAVTTDDRGEFRIAWLSPGDYFISVAAPTPARGQAPPVSGQDTYVRTYFPGVTEASAASALTVMESGEASAEFRLRSVPSYKITGRAVNLAGIPANVDSFYFAPRGADAQGDAQPLSFRNTSAADARTTGQFELAGVPSGVYDLYPLIRDETSGRYLGGRMPVTVNGNVEGVTAVIHPNPDVQVRVVVEGSDSARIPEPRLQLRETIPTAFTSGRPPTATAGPDGSFTFRDVPEARYTVQATVPPNSYIADIREGPVSVFKDGLLVGTRPPGLVEVIVKSDGGTLDGTVASPEGQALADVTVVLVPALEFREISAMYKVQQTNAEGRFSVSGIMPGEYKLFAWKSVANSAWENPAFLARYEELARAVSVAPNAHLNIASLSPLQ